MFSTPVRTGLALVTAAAAVLVFGAAAAAGAAKTRSEHFQGPVHAGNPAEYVQFRADEHKNRARKWVVDDVTNFVAHLNYKCFDQGHTEKNVIDLPFTDGSGYVLMNVDRGGSFEGKATNPFYTMSVSGDFGGDRINPTKATGEVQVNKVTFGSETCYPVDGDLKQWSAKPL